MAGHNIACNCFFGISPTKSIHLFTKRVNGKNAGICFCEIDLFYSFYYGFFKQALKATLYKARLTDFTQSAKKSVCASYALFLLLYFLQEQRRRLLFAVHRTVSIAQSGNGADNCKIRQIGKSKHFCPNADRGKPGVGSTAEYCSIAERGCK